MSEDKVSTFERVKLARVNSPGALWVRVIGQSICPTSTMIFMEEFSKPPALDSNDGKRPAELRLKAGKLVSFCRCRNLSTYQLQPTDTGWNRMPLVDYRRSPFHQNKVSRRSVEGRRNYTCARLSRKFGVLEFWSFALQPYFPLLGQDKTKIHWFAIFRIWKHHLRIFIASAKSYDVCWMEINAVCVSDIVVDAEGDDSGTNRELNGKPANNKSASN